VTTIDQQRLAIKTQTGAIVEVQLNNQTRFKEKANPKGINQPAVGDRVVVETIEDNKTLIATEVHFSAAK
jgi:putative ribosome biogenesis GTPase RsgA